MHQPCEIGDMIDFYGSMGDATGYLGIDSPIVDLGGWDELHRQMCRLQVVYILQFAMAIHQANQDPLEVALEQMPVEWMYRA